MTGDEIPDADYVSRLCSGGVMDQGRVTAAAFFLKDHEFVSVNWLEVLGLPTREKQLAEIRRVLVGKGITVRKSGRLAVLNAGAVRQTVSSQASQSIGISHQPELGDPSHSGIFYPAFDPALVEYLAQFVANCVSDIRPALIP